LACWPRCPADLGGPPVTAAAGSMESAPPARGPGARSNLQARAPAAAPARG